MKKIAIVGANGKMGSAVCKRLENDFEIIKVELGDSVENYNNLDVVIDFATHETSVNSAKFCAKTKVPLIIGSTGQTDDEMKVIKMASSKTAILKSGNFSIGIAIVKKLISIILKEEIDDVTILEKHHKSKKDSPSGTAIELASLIKQKNQNLQILSQRGGKEVGIHEIDFYFKDEKITLSHQAFSRQAFADGVFLAVNYILSVNKAGFYSMQNILK